MRFFLFLLDGLLCCYTVAMESLLVTGTNYGIGELFIKYPLPLSSACHFQVLKKHWIQKMTQQEHMGRYPGWFRGSTRTHRLTTPWTFVSPSVVPVENAISLSSKSSQKAYPTHHKSLHTMQKSKGMNNMVES